MVSARVTVAELYLTDLCYEENAETECEKYVNLALEIHGDSDNKESEPCTIDALQTAANLRLSQQRPKQAQQYILRAYNRMKTGCEALAKLVGLDDGEQKKAKCKRSVELVEVDAANNLPGLEFRCQTAKLLLECASAVASTNDDDDNGNDKKPPVVAAAAKQSPQQHGEDDDQRNCYKAAIHVLGSLLAENDEIPETYYLLGCAYRGLHYDSNNNNNNNNTNNNGGIDLAKYYWSQALEMLTNIQKELEEQQSEQQTSMQDDGEDDDENEEIEMQLQSIACQMEEIRSKLEDLEDDDDEMEE